MKFLVKIYTTLIMILVSSCSSSSSNSESIKNDPIQRSIDSIIRDISVHKYAEAKKRVSGLGSNDQEVSYFVKDQYSNKYHKVTFKIAVIDEFLGELIKLKNTLVNACSTESPKLKQLVQTELSAQKSMGHGSDVLELLKLRISSECYNRSSSYDFIRKVHDDIEDMLNELSQRSDYYRDGDWNIFGAVVMSQCEDEQRMAETIFDMYKCLVAELIKKSDTEFNKASESYYQKRLANSKLKKKAEREQQEKEDKDGTSIFKSYCWTLQVLKKSNEEIARQKEIGKEVGFVDTKLLYDYGQTVFDFKARKLAQEKEYLRLAGKKIDSTKCSEINGF